MGKYLYYTGFINVGFSTKYTRYYFLSQLLVEAYGMLFMNSVSERSTRN